MSSVIFLTPKVRQTEAECDNLFQEECVLEKGSYTGPRLSLCQQPLVCVLGHEFAPRSLHVIGGNDSYINYFLRQLLC